MRIFIPKIFVLFFSQKQEINKFDESREQSVFSVTCAYDIPRCVYNSRKHKFEMVKETRQFLNEASTKIEYLKDR